MTPDAETFVIASLARIQKRLIRSLVGFSKVCEVRMEIQMGARLFLSETRGLQQRLLLSKINDLSWFWLL